MIAEEQIGWMSMSKDKDNNGGEKESKDNGESKRGGSTKVQPVAT